MTPNEEAQDSGKYIRGMTSQPKPGCPIVTNEVVQSDVQRGAPF